MLLTARAPRISRPPAVIAVLAASVTVVLAGHAGARAVAADATGERPVVSSFRFKPTTLRRGHRGAFSFLTTREGAGSLTLARITSRGRLVPAGRLRFAVDAGEGRKAFDGRVARKRLAPGLYHATVTVTNAAGGRSQARRLTFRIAR